MKNRYSSILLLLCSYFQIKTFAQLESCIIVYDNMDNFPYPGWIFSTEAMVETYAYGKLNGKCPSDACVHIYGNYPVMGRIFDNVKSYSEQFVVNVQIKYNVWAHPGYLVQYKWSSDTDNHDWTGDWIDLYSPLWGEDRPANHTHHLEDPPFGDVLLYMRFGWPPYCNDYCEMTPDIYIDNFYLLAEMSSCPTEEPTTTLTTLPATTQGTTTSTTLNEPDSGEKEVSKFSLSSDMLNIIIFIICGIIFVIVICCIVKVCNNHSKSKKETRDLVAAKNNLSTTKKYGVNDQTCQPQINTADENDEHNGNNMALDNNEEVEGEEIITVVTAN